MKKNFYTYDATSKEYTGFTTAFKAPHNPDEYLIPPNATMVVPPDYNVETQILTFNESTNKWKKTTKEVPIEPEPTLEEKINKKILDTKSKHLQSISDKIVISLGFSVYSTLNDFKLYKAVSDRRGGINIDVIDTENNVHSLTNSQLNTLINEVEDFLFDHIVIKNANINKAKKAKNDNDLNKI